MLCMDWGMRSSPACLEIAGESEIHFGHLVVV